MARAQGVDLQLSYEVPSAEPVLTALAYTVAANASVTASEEDPVLDNGAAVTTSITPPPPDLGSTSPGRRRS